MKWALLAVLVAAAVLRLWNLDLVGISHWDAGSYTAGPYGVGPYGKAYILPYYAPPLVPTLCWLAFETFGHTDTVAIALMALIGIITVAMLFRLARTLYGGAVALVSAAALAGMAYHVIFSRQPVTDATYTLLFILAMHKLWKGWWLGERHSFLSAGVFTGACLLTKYHGFFPLVVFTGLLLARKLARDHRDNPDANLTRGLKGLVIAGIVAAIPAIWLLVDIETSIGLEAFRANRAQWMPELGPWLIPQVGGYVLRCLTEWVAWLVLLPAALGFGVMLWRRRTADLALLLWVGLFLATLPLYANYPRLLLPLLPPLAMAAGLGACTAARWVRQALRLADPPLGLGLSVLLAAVLLGAGAWDTAPALQVRDRGYADAAAWLAEQGSDELQDLLLTQHAILFYMDGDDDHLTGATNGYLTYDEPGALQLLREGRFRFLVADLRSLTLPADVQAALDSTKPHLREVMTIPNPLPEPFVVNLEGFAGLDALRSADPAEPAVAYRKALENIVIWRHYPGP